MGHRHSNLSPLEKEIVKDNIPSTERYYGLVNFGNTCYCNSVLQALYFCQPFRDRVLQHRAHSKRKTETLLSCLGDLFHNISSQKKRVGTVAPRKFVSRVKKEGPFDNFTQQDAHEFLNYLLNSMADSLVAEKTDKTEPNPTTTTTRRRLGTSPPFVNRPTGAGSAAAAVAAAAASSSTSKSWIHELFEGTLRNETRCLNCETVSSKDEDFLDLSVDVEDNSSLSHSLRVFANTETLCSDQKYDCDVCRSKQEAQKRMRIKRLPRILALHLKRFKYLDDLQRYTKLSHRMAFPVELRLSHSPGETGDDNDELFDLVAVVVHCGPGPNRGHYISLVKSQGFWLLFDDDVVERIDPASLQHFFGISSEVQKPAESAYILFYQARD